MTITKSSLSLLFHHIPIALPGRVVNRFAILLLLLVVACCNNIIVVESKQNEGYDLDSDSPIRIGIMKRIPKRECQVKSSKGDILSVHYVGTLYKDNTEFDSSRERNVPFTFQLGNKEVIRGWDIGLSNMCIGEIRKLTIPSDLAYAEEGAPPKIYPGATIVFEIELIEISRSDDGNKEEEEYDIDSYWNN